MDNHLTERVSPKLDFELRDQQGRPLYPKSKYNLITATVPSFMYLWRMEFKKEYEPAEEPNGNQQPDGARIE